MPWSTTRSNAYLSLLVGILLSLWQLQQLSLIRTALWIPDEATSSLATWTPSASVTRSRLPDQWSWLESSLASSHFVELDHCSLEGLDEQSFGRWANPILDRVMAAKNSTDVRNEWTLQLLEIQATHQGLCHFDDWYPSSNRLLARDNVVAGQQLQRIVAQTPTPPGLARLAICIIAYQDAVHLQRLIEAVYLPHHYIIVHMEASARGTPFYHSVQRISRSYNNVVVVCFGTVIYKTDSVSHINLQLMKWLHELNLEYDHHLSLGGAVYPLWSPTELARHLHASSGHVWMGALTHKGQSVHHPQWSLLWKKRLLVSSEKMTVKAGYVVGSEETVPAWMNHVLQHKATSGNQAVYSRQVIQQLLGSQRAKQILAMAKYGCCCCVEERSWIAIMDVLGYLEQALSQRSMFQWWGGDEGTCRGSMNNAVLDLNSERCYRSEDPGASNSYVWGNETWSELVRAKNEGVLFARKFRSDHPRSVALLEKIRNELHGK